jgi:hypothetical protein
LLIDDVRFSFLRGSVEWLTGHFSSLPKLLMTLLTVFM